MQKTHTSAFSTTSFNANNIADQTVNATLNGRLTGLEILMHEVGNYVEMQRKEFEQLQHEKEELAKLLTSKTEEMLKTLMNEALHLEDEVKREIGFQRAENSRMQQQLTHLKGEKHALQIQYSGLQRRIADLEVQVGNSEQN